MAESEKTSNPKNKFPRRRELDDDSFRILQFTRQGDVERGAVMRGAQVKRGTPNSSEDHLANAFVGNMGAYAKPTMDATPVEQNLPVATDKDLGLMNLCSKVENDKEFFDRVVAAIRSLKNCDLTVLDWVMFGNKYLQGRYVEFLIAFYGVGKETKIDMKRMSGDGFAMAAFFTEVKNQLKKEDLIIAVDEDSEEFVYSSEDESDDSGEEEDNLADGYLQLAYDPKIVPTWIAKIQNRHVEDQLHMLGLMAFNASNKQNLDIIVNEGGKKLKALFINKFENSNIAALVRFTSELAKYVTGHRDCKNHGYDEEFLVAILDTIKFWVPGKANTSFSEKNRQQSTKFEVTESGETVMNLVEVMYNLGETMKIFPKETILLLAKKRLVKKKKSGYKKVSPKDDILRFLKTQEETLPATYFRHILNEI